MSLNNNKNIIFVKHILVNKLMFYAIIQAIISKVRQDTIVYNNKIESYGEN